MLPNWQFYREIDLTAYTGDADWAGSPSSITVSSVEPFLFSNSIDGVRGASTIVSLYANLYTTAGARVDRGAMAFDVIPIEIARPGSPGVPGINGAESATVIDGESVGGHPDEKVTLQLGPKGCRAGIRFANVTGIPVTATRMRVFWRPGY